MKSDPKKDALHAPHAIEGKKPAKINRTRRQVLCKRRRRLNANMVLTHRISKMKEKGSRKWTARGGYLDTVGVTNEDLMRTTASVGARDGKRRMEALFGRMNQHKAKRKIMYHTTSGSMRTRGRGHVPKPGKIYSAPEVRTPHTFVKSMVFIVEQRVDVLLFRAGLTHSLAQAHARCTQGHVRRRRKGETEPRVWIYPSSPLPVGACLQRDAKTWVKRAPQLITRVSSQTSSTHPTNPKAVESPENMNHWTVPAYRRVDLEQGALCRLHIPRTGEVQYPADASRSLMPFLR